MLVSAIITTCKREPELVERALRSVINQKYNKIEIVVVDDSPDDYPLRNLVKDKVLSYKSIVSNLKYVMHQKNLGACAARNTGVAESNGEILGFLDDDDEWTPNKVEVMIGRFQDQEVGLVYGNNILINDDTGEEKVVIRNEITGKIYDKLILENFIGSTSFPLIRRESLVAVGGFDVNMQSAQDVDLYLRISRKYSIDYVNAIIARYHINRGKRISSDVEKKIAGLERLNKKNQEYINANKNAFWIRNMKLIPYYTKNRDISKAYSIWSICVKRHPQKLMGNIKYLICMVFGYVKSVCRQ